MKNQVKVFHRAVRMNKRILERALDRSQKVVIFFSSLLAIGEAIKATFGIGNVYTDLAVLFINAFIALYIAFIKFNKYVDRIKAAEAGEQKISMLGEEFDKSRVVSLDLWLILNEMFARATKEFEGLMTPSEQDKASKKALKDHIKELGRNNKLKFAMGDAELGLTRSEKKKMKQKEASTPGALALTNSAHNGSKSLSDAAHQRTGTWSNIFNFRRKTKQTTA